MSAIGEIWKSVDQSVRSVPFRISIVLLFPLPLPNPDERILRLSDSIISYIFPHSLLRRLPTSTVEEDFIIVDLFNVISIVTNVMTIVIRRITRDTRSPLFFGSRGILENMPVVQKFSQLNTENRHLLLVKLHDISKTST